MKDKISRVGEINYNRYGSKMTIVEYISTNKIIVRFENGYTVKTAYKEFKNGCISNPYDKSVYGIGYMGEGKYKTREKDKDKHTKCYDTWRGMFRRCYDEKYHRKEPTYIGCSICEEWLNFQNFAEWYDKNYYEFEDQIMHLDKDILHKGNKIYSPENCVFVIQSINSLFTKNNAIRGDCCIGVTYDKNANKYIAKCSKIIDGHKKSINIGRYDTEYKAFGAYKNFKEKVIKEVADLYKDKIPQKLYEALYRYEVEITD